MLLNGFSMWVLLCSFKWPVIGKILSYFEQFKGFSPVWGWFHDEYVEKLLSQFLHLNGFSPVWVLLCSFKSPVIGKILSYFEHLKGFSPVWVWFRGKYVEKRLSQFFAVMSIHSFHKVVIFHVYFILIKIEALILRHFIKS